MLIAFMMHSALILSIKEVAIHVQCMSIFTREDNCFADGNAVYEIVTHTFKQ